MAITNIAEIKEWFKTGLFPTQAQFWSTFDSFLHKHEGVVVKHPTQSEIDAGLTSLFAKTNGGDIEFPTKSGYEVSKDTVTFGKFTIYKADGNSELGNLQSGDMIIGWWSTNKFIRAIYVSGLVTDLGSYNILEEIDF